MSAPRKHRYKVLGTSRDRRTVRVYDRIHKRSFYIRAQGTRLVFWDRNYGRDKQPVTNPTLRKLATERLG